MRVALGIVSYFATGGLQRDCVRIARRLIQLGHEVTIFTSRTDGTQPLDLKMVVLPCQALTNHGRNAIFNWHFRRAVENSFDRIVGFDKLSGLDVLYCADECVRRRPVNRLGFLWPRYNVLLRLEEACFGEGRPTRIVVLSNEQLAAYRAAWGTESARVTLISPTIEEFRRRPEFRDDGTRERVRAEIGVASDDWLWLSIGAYMHTKGMDRTLEALRAFPRARLVIAGIEPGGRRGRAIRKEIRRSGCADRVRLVGRREDVPALMAAADLFVHPARRETTGTVILEAVINGLPVVATSVCGYAEHIDRATAGLVVPEPFSARTFKIALATASDPAQAATWSENGRRYGDRRDLYRGLDEAADVIID